MLINEYYEKIMNNSDKSKYFLWVSWLKWLNFEKHKQNINCNNFTNILDYIFYYINH
jgi:hypothetical protein